MRFHFDMNNSLIKSNIMRAFLCLASVYAGSPAIAADCSAETKSSKARYTSARVNLRSLPSRYGDIYATLPPGQLVYAFRSSDGWSRVNVAAMNITGYIATRYLTTDCNEGKELTRTDLNDTSVTVLLISQSKYSYSGSCPCPDSYDRGGRRCGGRSAYSRPGGKSPLCYARDITPQMLSLIHI